MKVINRIKKTQDFGLAINKGKTFRLPNFIIHVKNNDLGLTRVGISASSKLGHAVVRNRIKRQVRAMLATRNDYSSSINIIVVIRPNYDETKFHANEQELNDLLNKTKEI